MSCNLPDYTECGSGIPIIWIYPKKGPDNTVIEFWRKDTCMQTLINQTKSSSKKIVASRNKDSLQYSTQNNWDVPKSSLLNISQCFFSWFFPMIGCAREHLGAANQRPASVGDPSGSAPKRSQRKFEPFRPQMMNSHLPPSGCGGMSRDRKWSDQWLIDGLFHLYL